MLNEDALLAGADAEFKRMLGRTVLLDVQIQTLIVLVGLIQLACRHPKVRDDIRETAERFVNEIGAGLQERGLHELAALVKAGWLHHGD